MSCYTLQKLYTLSNKHRVYMSCYTLQKLYTLSNKHRVHISCYTLQKLYTLSNKHRVLAVIHCKSSIHILTKTGYYFFHQDFKIHKQDFLWDWRWVQLQIFTQLSIIAKSSSFQMCKKSAANEFSLLIFTTENEKYMFCDALR
jgi:hypothetical protein